MNLFGVPSGEQVPGLPEEDRPTVEYRWNEVTRAVTNVLDLASRLGEVPGAAPMAEQVSASTPNTGTEVQDEFELSPEAIQNDQYLDAIAGKAPSTPDNVINASDRFGQNNEAIVAAQKEVDDAFAA